MGLQKRASYISIASFYLLGIPIGCVLGLKFNLGVLGLEAGFGVAIIFQCIAYAFMLSCTDWQRVADEAVKRIEKEELKAAVTLPSETFLSKSLNSNRAD